MTEKGYQTNYSEVYAHKTHYDENRDIKADKTLAVVEDYFSGRELSSLKVLEIGCYKGDVSIYLSPRFKKFYGIDIDEKAIKQAQSKKKPENLEFFASNAEELEFEDASFDLVICSHVYEHIPHPEVMMREIKRVLKTGGACYFAAGNKIRVIEPHYRLPFLSCIPKKLAHFYLKITGKGDHYYESLFTMWKLKELVSDFEIEDYSAEIIKHPQQYKATDMVEKGSFKQKAALWVFRNLKFLFPTYIWMLRKR